MPVSRQIASDLESKINLNWHSFSNIGSSGLDDHIEKTKDSFLGDSSRINSEDLLMSEDNKEASENTPCLIYGTELSEWHWCPTSLGWWQEKYKKIKCSRNNSEDLLLSSSGLGDRIENIENLLLSEEKNLTVENLPCEVRRIENMQQN